MAVPERSMTELLERAVELCPERFRIARAHMSTLDGILTEPLQDVLDVRVGPEFVSVADRFDRFYIHEPEEAAHALILAGTIEAIEAWGWTWSVGCNAGRPYYFAVIQPRAMVTHGDSPAHALLAGFVATLEEESAASCMDEANRELSHQMLEENQ